MVEVWLSYKDTELPLMLPDPIDLKISPKTLVPEVREAEAIKKLYKILKEYSEIKICFNPIVDEFERNYIRGILNKTGLPSQESNCGDANIYIDVFRYDPILNFKSSIWIGYLHDKPVDKLIELCDEGDIDPKKYFVDMDKLYIDLIVDGGPRLVNIFTSTDGSHYDDALKYYSSKWCLRVDPPPLVISSVGGAPWDSSIYSIVSSIIKLKNILREDSIGVLVGDGVIKTFDPTKLKSFKAEYIEKPYEIYLYYLLEKSTIHRAIVYYGSIPGSIIKYFGVKRVRDLESYINSLPMRRKRDILVIEDLTFLYPYRCSE